VTPLVLAALALAACSGDDEGPRDLSGEPEFVAAEPDFAPFRSWQSFKLPDSDPISDIVYPAGSRLAFLNQRPPHGATSYPVGTIIVKAIERGMGPQDWEIFAIAKRGRDYNAQGAIGWEFFLLDIDAGDVPRISSRGIMPSDDGKGDASPKPANASGYVVNGDILPCNICHGEAKNAATDHIVSPLLAPSATAL
jgi:hypothetical protein